MFDPAVIGTTILWLESEKRSEAEAARSRHVLAIKERGSGRRLSRSLARWLRSAADRLEPAASSDARPA